MDYISTQSARHGLPDMHTLGAVPDEDGALELTQASLDRLDEIDNAVYSVILTLIEKDEDEFPWDMERIAGVTDAIKSALAPYGLNVRHPGIGMDSDGKQYYLE